MIKYDTLSRKIKNFWKERAKNYGEGPEASWGDLLMEKEASTLLNYIKDGDYILDAGCANGYSSIKLIKEREIKLVGIDYSAEMIKQANKAKKILNKNLKKRIEFMRGDVLDLKFPDETFDKVNMTRCLCNLTKWRHQEEALQQARRILKPNGVLLVSEPTIQGLRKLNKIGRAFGLKPLSPPWHNLYLDERKLIKFIKPYFELEINHFSSTYYLFSRILYRWFLQDQSEKLKRNSIFNKIGVRLPPLGDWGVQRLYILTKNR